MKKKTLVNIFKSTGYAFLIIPYFGLLIWFPLNAIANIIEVTPIKR